MCLPVWGSHAFAQESYAVYDKYKATLTFKHDTKKPTGAFALNEGRNLPGWYKHGDYEYNANIIKKVIFDASFAKARPTSCYGWFYGCKYLKTIKGIEYLNTENVTDMWGMFWKCNSLTTLDLSSFNTKNVTNMNYMFSGCSGLSECSGLTTIYASDKFVTTACVDDYNMFAYCTDLVGAVPYDDHKVGKEMANYTTGYFTYKAPTETYAVFDKTTNTLTFKRDTNKPTGAFALNEGRNFPGWYNPYNNECNTNNIKKVVFDASFANARPTSCYSWFYGCKYLTTIEGIEYLNTENVTDMWGMFWQCYALTTLDVSNFDTKNVTNMSEMFSGCFGLTTIYASEKFVTTTCVDDYNMFAYCANLVGAVPYNENKVNKEMANYTTGYFTYKAPEVASSYAVFDEDTNTLTFKHDTKKPYGAFELNEGENAPGWFQPNYDGYNINTIKKVVFDASFANARPTSCYKWFYRCKKLTTIEGIEYLNTENVTNMSSMFSGCWALTTLDLSNFDTKNVTNMSYMFHCCYDLKTLDLLNFDTQNVTDMEGMFFKCNLISLDLSSFDTQNVTNMHSMFWGCFSDLYLRTTLDLSNFDTKNVAYMDLMFFGCFGLKTIYASEKYVTTANGGNMFLGCDNLVGAVPYDENKVGKEMANYTTGYFTYKAATGIDAPTVSDNTAAEYYDLQGRRLNAPQKGVNIVKRGKKTTKVLVK